MKEFCVFLLVLFSSCHEKSNNKSLLSNDIDNQTINNKEDVFCPTGHHKDSIIPIIYGYPSEEMWQQSDSGLIALGGCEIEDYTHYCTIHEISF